MASEREWDKGTLTTSFLDRVLKNSKSVFGSDIASAFKAQLSPKQKRYLEAAYNVGGKIADTIATFKGQQSTSESDVYKGDLEVLVNSKDQEYHIYKITPLVIGNQVLNEKLLVKAPGTGIAFTAKDLGLFGDCELTTNGTEGSICKTQFTPSIVAKKCAQEILQSKPLDSCDFVSAN